MKCRQCKLDIPKGAKICTHCGAKQGMGCGGLLGIVILIAIAIPVLNGFFEAKNGNSTSSSLVSATNSSQSSEESIIETIKPALVEIDINADDISSFKQIADWANGERYSFNYCDIGFLVYMNKDGTLNSINSGDVKFYSDGKANCSVLDRIITSSDKAQLETWAEEQALKQLLAPSTAKFPIWDGWEFARDKNRYQVNGYVDADNAYGVAVRHDFKLIVNWDKSTGKATIESFAMN